MIFRLFTFALCSVVLSLPCIAMDGTPTLSLTGEVLGRLRADEINLPLSITINLNGDKPYATHVMARFQNNQPQQRLEGGDWEVWNEKQDSLKDNSFIANAEGFLTFNVAYEDLSNRFLPIIFTIAYHTDSGLKSGYFVVDR